MVADREGARERDGTRENGCADQIRMREVTLENGLFIHKYVLLFFGAPIDRFEAGVSSRQRAKIDKNLFEIIKSRLPGEQNMWI